MSSSISPVPKPQTRNGSYIPMPEGRGFTSRFDKKTCPNEEAGEIYTIWY
jgi:hypothetical protein